MTKKQQPTTLDSFKREAIEKIYQGKPLTGLPHINFHRQI